MKKVLLILLLLSIVWLKTTSGYFIEFSGASAINVFGIIQVSSWPQPFEYDASKTYEENDLVFLDMVIYRSLRNNNKRIPGSNGSQNFWEIES